MGSDLLVFERWQRLGGDRNEESMVERTTLAAGARDRLVVDQAGASAPAGAIGLLGGVLVGSSFTVLARYNSYLGFYEVDRHGQPLRYLGQEALPYLKHRLPVRRRTFLRAVAPQDQGAR